MRDELKLNSNNGGDENIIRFGNIWYGVSRDLIIDLAKIRSVRIRIGEVDLFEIKMRKEKRDESRQH